MMSSNWLFEIILLLHSLSLIGFIIYFISSNWKVKRFAFWLFVVVWTMQTASIVSEIITTKTFPILSLNDGIYFYAWILLTFTLIINQLHQVHLIALLTNVFTYFLMSLATILNVQQQSV